MRAHLAGGFEEHHGSLFLWGFSYEHSGTLVTRVGADIMKARIKKLLKEKLLFRVKKRRRQLSPVFHKGFHGDEYLLSLVDDIMQWVDAFVETGTNVGQTARYMAKTYPHVPVYSCEPDLEAFKAARQTLRGCENGHLYNMKSPDFLYAVHKEHPSLITSMNLYFLDAHGWGFEWPLKEEIRFITTQLDRAVIIIDDAEVPDNPQFKYATYDGQKCNLEYIIQGLAVGKRYSLCYPAYTERTSLHHPLVGYIVIEFGSQIVERVINKSNDFIVSTLEL